MTFFNGDEYLVSISEDYHNGEYMLMCIRYDSDWNRYNHMEFHLLSSILEDGYVEIVND